jgi:putative ABC transport system permease protein
MNAQIIAAGLRARPVRTAVSVLAVTLEVVLILLLVGLTNGTVDETGRRVAGVGAEVLLKAKDSSYFVGMNNATLPVKELGGDLAKVEGIQAVAPVVTQTDIPGGFTVVYGIDPPSFEAISGGFTFLQGRMFSAPNEAIVDDRQAGTKMIAIGDKVKLLNQEFNVTGIVENGKGARVFIPIGTAQEMSGRAGFATMFYIKLHSGVVVADAIANLKETFKEEGFEVVDVEEFVTLMFGSIAGLMNAVFQLIVLLGVSIGVLVIFLSMYTTVTERTREIGILRSMGATKGFIVRLVLQESLFLCVIGAVVGIGASYLIRELLGALLPTVIILITPGWLVRATVFALLSGLIGSFYPAYKAASADPIEALAYE